MIDFILDAAGAAFCVNPPYPTNKPTHTHTRARARAHRLPRDRVVVGGMRAQTRLHVRVAHGRKDGAVRGHDEEGERLEEGARVGLARLGGGRLRGVDHQVVQGVLDLCGRARVRVCVYVCVCSMRA